MSAEDFERMHGAAPNGAAPPESPPPPPEHMMCSLPAVDLGLVFQPTPPPPPRLLINKLCTVGSSGLLAGPGSGGKSFLELVKLVCLATGRPFLDTFEVEQTPVLAYFSEDSGTEIVMRLRKICAALNIDAGKLLCNGSLQIEIVPTVGAARALFEVNPKTKMTVPTDWFYAAVDRAKKSKARYLSFDHIGRYWRIEHYFDNSQVFDAFTFSDRAAMELDGVICYLHHPNRSSTVNGGERAILAAK